MGDQTDPSQTDAGQPDGSREAQDPSTAGQPISPDDFQDKGKPPMIASRHTLPATRDSLTHKFSVGSHEGYLTVGLYPDGRPGEIFLKMSKEGSTMSGMCQAFCRAFSLSIQLGLPLQDAIARFKGMRFEPMGSTSNPEIPEASSIVDYIAKYLELNYKSNGRLK
jgi:ribonucleoside-diphosphate reductase alpha chain